MQGSAGELFVSAVEAIYSAAPNPASWPDVLQKIADVFDDVGTNLLYRRDDGSFGAISSPSLQAANADFAAGWHRHDIRAQRAVEYGYGDREATTDHHYITPGEIATHPFYTQFLARHGLRWFVAMEISPDPHVWVAIAVQRAASRPPYSDDEVELMTRLGRHVEQSLRLSIRLLDAELANVGLGEALARLNIGVFVLDGLGRIVFANPAGERLIGSGLAVVDQRLTTGMVNRTALESALSATLDAATADLIDKPPRSILIHRPPSDRPLTLYVLPVKGQFDPAIGQFLTRARAIVLAIDQAPHEPPDPAVVRDVLGVTLGEARVAALVGSGLPPREAAERLGISEETARTVLKRVFSKLGVSRQSELAGLLTRLVLK